MQHLPEDFRQALAAEAALYRTSLLELEEDGLAIESPMLLRLRPLRQVTGEPLFALVHAFSDDAVPLFTGEVVHTDPRSGELLIWSRLKALDALEPLLNARFFLEPFDFSAALRGAAEALASNRARLEVALRAVQGELEAPRGGPWESPFGFIWGPPGTGKTQTVAAALAQMLKTKDAPAILAVAPTHRAADVLARRVAELCGREQLAAVETFPIFRGGMGVGAELLRDWPELSREKELATVARRIEELQGELELLATKRGTARAQAELRARILGLRRTIPDPTLAVVQRGKTPLVVTTVHRALKLVCELGGAERFSQLVVDEAGMVPRAAAALLAPLARRVLFAGDPRQLGPISQAPEGEGSGVRRWLRRSALSHLADAHAARGRKDLAFLEVQHRMHPEVGEVVSRFAYAGMLRHGEGTSRPGGRVEGARAVWVVLDRCAEQQRQVAHERSPLGRGYERPFSAELAVRLARRSVERGLSVLCLTPYRAQVQRLMAAAEQSALKPGAFLASTIHRQQGSEADVVIVDTVAGGRPFAADELASLLNVAASRAREQLFVLSSIAERQATTAGAFLSLLGPHRVSSERGGALLLEPTSVPPHETPLKLSRGELLGDELAELTLRAPLFTQAQHALFERGISDGHHLVRGVAGSGKSFVLAQWAVRFLQAHPKSRILVTFFNLGLGSMLERLLLLAGQALFERDPRWRERITLRQAHHAAAEGGGPYDAVFVDEAQDFDGALLAEVYAMAKVSEETGKRPFLLFADDSQNVYGNRPLEELGEALPDKLDFKGRVSVLKEAFRSTREVLDLAFNVVLDPKKRHTVTNPGMRELLKVRELEQQGLLLAPKPGALEHFRVSYTERRGVAPLIFGFRSAAQEERYIAMEIQRLVRDEKVSPGAILVVAPARPLRLAQAISKLGVRAVAYGGTGGEHPSRLTATADHVRVTTVFSCKGHESPIVFFAGLDALDDIRWLRNEKPKSAREEERTRRCLFYVGATRAMVRLYLTGLDSARFVQNARAYAAELFGGRERPG